MAEPFQIVVSGIAVANLAFSLYTSLGEFVDKAKNADKTAEGLCREAEKLRSTLYAVHSAVRRTERVRRKQVDANPEEKHILSKINESLEDWQRTLLEFQQELEGLDAAVDEHSRLTWVDKVLLQLHLGRRAPAIETLDKRIEEHIQELMLWLHCLEIYIHAGHYKHFLDLLRGFKQIEWLISHMSERCNEDSEVGNGHVRTAREFIAATHTVVTKVSGSEEGRRLLIESFTEQDGSKMDIPYEGDEQELERSEVDDPRTRITEASENAVTASAIISSYEDEDPDPAFDAATPHELLNALIENYRGEVRWALKAEQYATAEDEQRKLIDYLDERKRYRYTRLFDSDTPQGASLSNVMYRESKDIINAREPPAKHISLDVEPTCIDIGEDDKLSKKNDVRNR